MRRYIYIYIYTGAYMDTYYIYILYRLLDIHILYNGVRRYINNKINVLTRILNIISNIQYTKNPSYKNISFIHYASAVRLYNTIYI